MRDRGMIHEKCHLKCPFKMGLIVFVIVNSCWSLSGVLNLGMCQLTIVWVAVEPVLEKVYKFLFIDNINMSCSK